MVVRVCERVLQAIPHAELIVATDDDRVSKAVLSNGYKSFLSSLPHLSGTDRIAEVSATLGWHEQTRIINVQGDEPLVPVELLRGFYEYVQAQPLFEMATVSCPFDSVNDAKDPSKVKVVVTPSESAVYFSRSVIPFNRELGINEKNLSQLKKHLGIYAYSASTLAKIAGMPPTPNELTESLEQLRAIDNRIDLKVLHSEMRASPGVDTPEDLEKVRKLYRKCDEPY
jgi:3-deoxy-manno-octulosonate cytidylyltransferase (CMP-KDO synthetase)